MKSFTRLFSGNTKENAVSLPTRLKLSAFSPRGFLMCILMAGAALGLGFGLPGCGDSGGSVVTPSGSPKELRTYLFNLSHMDTSAHDMIMVAGKKRQKLEPVTQEVLAGVRQNHPILGYVPDADVTHFIEIEMPVNGIQLCYLQRVFQSATDGSWDMALMFYHLPKSGLKQARDLAQSLLASGEKLAVPVNWARYGLTADDLTKLADPVGEDMLKDTTSQATALVASHPETSCAEPTSAAYIQNNIIATQPSTQVLGEVIQAQGPATPSGGWATQTPLIDPDTGQQAVNSKGQLQYMPVWSQETLQYTGQAITPALTTVKNDTTLGANVTDIDPTGSMAPGVAESTNGAIWTLFNGMPTIDQSDESVMSSNSGVSYKFTDQSPGHGYSASVSNVDISYSKVTMSVKNWYLRYLSLYVRYLDANGDPISVSDVVSDLGGKDQAENLFPLWLCCNEWNGTYDFFLNLVSPEYVILGMPIESATVDVTFPMPGSASSFLLLAGGIGRGSNPYPDTLVPGETMTGIFNLSMPPLFLALNAAAGYTSLTKSLEGSSQTLLSNLPLILQIFADVFASISYDDVTKFVSLGVDIGEKLLASNAKPIAQLVANAIAEGETVDDILDAVPVIGGFLAAVAAVGTVADITETSAEVAQSPRAYSGLMNLTHDIQVTINHDPNDDAGFPATATYFTVTAQFDNGTPHTITQDMPATQTTTPRVVTFTDVPLGGKVTFNVGFYSSDGWLAGNGSDGPEDNTDPVSGLITITENKVPLNSETVYTHKEIIVLDDDGNHQWEATKTPPSEVRPSGCNPDNGQLCQLNGITISTTNAQVGQAWQAYNSSVDNCSSGGASQLFQFANLSITEDPQSGYLFSGCGFEGSVRIVYDLLGNDDFNFYIDPTDGNNLIRQIRLSGGTPSFDGPRSNKAWGKLEFASDALLLHPAGHIISINGDKNKIEVVKLPDAAVADAEAPLTQVYAGKGIREGLVTGPTHAALHPDGSILILESGNNRIQAFDLHANPAPIFGGGAYYVPLKDTPTAYLDLAVEYTGYMYVLSYVTGESGEEAFRLDIYTPEGDWLARTPGVNAARLAVNYWRDIFTQNYQVLKLPDGSLPARTEPSISHWIPSTP
jgi:hypothetical protein